MLPIIVLAATAAYAFATLGRAREGNNIDRHIATVKGWTAMDLFSEEMRRNPYPLYAQLRSVSPVFHACRNSICG